MARTSLTTAKAELFALLNGLVSGVDAYYDHEPASGHRQGGTTLTVATAGLTPTHWLYTIRLYVDGMVDAEKAQEDLDTLVPAIDALVSSGFGPGEWTFEWNPEIEAWIATNQLGCIRNDY